LRGGRHSRRSRRRVTNGSERETSFVIPIFTPRSTSVSCSEKVTASLTACYFGTRRRTGVRWSRRRESERHVVPRASKCVPFLVSARRQEVSVTRGRPRNPRPICRRFPRPGQTFTSAAGASTGPARTRRGLRGAQSPLRSARAATGVAVLAPPRSRGPPPARPPWPRAARALAKRAPSRPMRASSRETRAASRRPKTNR